MCLGGIGKTEHPVQRDCVISGKEAERELCQFFDSMISADISVPSDDYEWPPASDPMPMAMKANDPRVEADLVCDADNLKMRCGCHKCKPSCTKHHPDGSTYCRFKFPQELAGQTHVKFVEKKDKHGKHGK